MSANIPAQPYTTLPLPPTIPTILNAENKSNRIKQNELTIANTDGDFDKAKDLLVEIQVLQERDLTNPPKSITVAEIEDKLDTLDQNRIRLKEVLSADMATLRDSLTSALDALKTDTEEKAAAAADAARLSVDEKLSKASRTTDAKVATLENKITSLEAKLQTTKEQLAASTDTKVAALSGTVNKNKKDLAILAQTVTTSVTELQKFRMPELGSWGQNNGNGGKTACSAQHKGEMRRIKGGDQKHIETIVYCTGTQWKRISPVVGTGVDDRLPGGGCIMRDVHSYRTTSSGCRTIDFKTNILARKATMYTITIKGYNYGSGRHIHNTASGYTYAHWSCAGSISHRNYGPGSNVESYCAGSNVVIRLRPNGGSYYLGLRMDAEFLNPTGDNMCGNFKVLATKCNGAF